MSDLAIIGPLSIDTLHFPGHNAKDVFGGNAGYAALSASLFTDVALAAQVGSDYPESFLNILKSRNIDISGIKKVDGKTPRFDITYDEELYKATYNTTDMNVMDTPMTLPQAVLEAKYVFISPMAPKMQLHIIDQLDPVLQTIATDTNDMWIKQDKATLEQVIRRTHVLFIEGHEACTLAGKHKLTSAAVDILEMGVEYIIARKGQNGAILFSKKKLQPLMAYDTFDMSVVDPTGVGGAVTGGFLGALAQDQVSEDKLNNIYGKALAFGEVMGSFTLEGYGISQLAKIDKTSVWVRYDRLRDILGL